MPKLEQAHEILRTALEGPRSDASRRIAIAVVDGGGHLRVLKTGVTPTSSDKDPLHRVPRRAKIAPATMTITATCALITAGQMRKNAGSTYF